MRDRSGPRCRLSEPISPDEANPNELVAAFTEYARMISGLQSHLDAASGSR